MAVTIVLTNQKGGVGKTTTAAALAAGLGRDGRRVLAVDLDPQGNLGFSLGLDIDDSLTIYDVFRNQTPLREAVHHTDGCDVIPSNILLSEAEIEFQNQNRVTLLKDNLAEVGKEYDFVIIDTPPSLNILTLNAYAASDYLIIPMSAEILSLVGLIQLQETVEAVRESVNPYLNVLGILLTKFNKRLRLSADVLEMAGTAAAQTQTSLFQTKIRTGVAAAEAPAHGADIFTYAPRSNPAKDYQMFIQEVIERIGQQHTGRKRRIISYE